MRNFNIKKYCRLIVLIIIFIILLVFRNTISSFLVGVFYQERIIETNNSKNFLDEEKVLLKGQVKTPGALKLINKFFNNEEIILSKRGVLDITNQYRKENNLKALKENSRLNISAEKKLKDILDNQYFEHISPTGVGMDKVVEEAGYRYILIGENLALGNFKDDKNLVDSWMGSKGHRENILNKNYTDIGIAVAKGVYKKNTVWVAVQHFGTPRSLCPTVEEYLNEKIKLNQKQIDVLKEDLETRLFKISREYVPYEGPKNVTEAEEYNNLVIYYNNLIDETDRAVEKYNNQVNSFNDCITKYQD